jgi:hypothetical protein
MVVTGGGKALWDDEQAHYSGRLENGNQFDSSYSRGKPLTFRVGVGEVSSFFFCLELRSDLHSLHMNLGLMFSSLDALL